MQLYSKPDLAAMEVRMLELARLEHLSSASDIWLSRVDGILPPTAISTETYAREHLKVKGRGETERRYDPDLTPYTAGINEACDLIGCNVVAVKGNARGAKTLSAEAHALKRWAHGPYGDVLWYMQSKEDVDDYMEERGEWMLEHHPEVTEKVDETYKRQARNRKKIGDSIARWLAATAGTTRGKAAPFIVADEIDGYRLAIAKSILTRLLNRQREYGSAALMYLCSHPDIGPQYGIESVLRRGLRHLWWWQCIHCKKPSSPAAEAPIRMNWNVPAMLPMLKGIDRLDALDYVREHARLVCPHCRGEITNEQRLVMSRETGAWVQPAQKLVGPKQVAGAHIVQDIMGFVIHGFMSPFINIGKAAVEWVTAKLDFDNNHDDTDLKEVTVKTLGEVYEGATAEIKIDDWETVKKRMTGGGAYLMGTVPDGVDFLTAFVDIQKGRFAVRVIGYAALSRESWLIDAYEITSWQDTELARSLGKVSMQKIDPFRVLSDWSILEEAVFQQSYPLERDMDWHLPIARVGIDTGGMDETTINARQFAANAIHRTKDPIREYRIMLLKGNAQKTGELYGVPRQVMKDDHGEGIKANPVDLLGPVWERTPLVSSIKKIVRHRQNIDVPGPGFMYAPANLPNEYFREIVSEKYIGGEWVQDGPNETWDAYVACETVRASLNPEDPLLKWETKPPIWARPFRPQIDPGIDMKRSTVVSPYARMVRSNRRN
jgi:phage terminase large subunit GpA-like protein